MEAIKLSIVIPVYNSEDCIEELNKQIQESLEEFDAYELILVNDRSKDNSWSKIVQVCEKNKKAIGISLRKNSGQDNAIMAGLKLTKGDYVAIMDDDLQHSPKDILNLYKTCNNGYDICFALFPTKKQKLWKNIGSWLNGKLSEKLLSKPKEIYLSPFKVFKKEVTLEMIKYTGPYPYIDALLLTISHNIIQIPIEHHKRFKGRSNFNFIKSATVFFKHATGYSIYPLRLATYTGFSSAFVAFIFSLYFLLDYFIRGSTVEGWTSIVLLVLFFGGIILISLGIIGEYVGRIFLTINKKPQYTIEKIVTNQVSAIKTEI